MAFGQELKDFVGGFTTGYNLIDSKEEREEKRAKRKREQESHDATMRWGERDRDTRDERYKVGDSQWEQQFGFSKERFGFQKSEAERNQGNIDRKFTNDENRYRLELDKENADAIGLQEYAIPDNSGANAAGEGSGDAGPQSSLYGGSVQTASFTPDNAAQTVEDTGGFNLATYLPNIKRAESSGRVNAKNPNSSALGLYQPLEGTWNAVAKKYPELGLTADGRTSPDQQERFIRRFTFDNGKALQSAGIPVTNGTMYAAHFLGAAGAKKVLKGDPSSSISQYVSSGVMRANPFLRGMTVGEFGDWAERKGTGQSTRKRRNKTISAAVGGMVTAIPEEDDGEEDSMFIPDSAFMASEPEQEETQVAEAAIPVPGDKPQYDGVMEGDEEAPTDDIHEQSRRAVRDGLKKSLALSGLDQENAIDDPALEKHRQMYLRGYGSAPAGMMRQAIDKVDPERKLPVSERNMLAIGTVYQYYVDRGDLEKAQAAAASMTQYYRQASTKFLALGQAAAAKGDLDNAAKAAVAGYANIPNGRDMQIEKQEDGSFNVSVTDEKSGKVISRQVVTPEQFASAAMGFNPSTFEQEIFDAAGMKDADIGAPKDSDKLAENEGRVKEVFDNGTEVDGMEQNRKDAIRDVATSIAGNSINGMGPDEAARFAIKLFEFNGDDENDDSANFIPKARKSRDGNYELNMDGQKVVISGAAYAKIKGLRGSMTNERVKARDDKKKSSEASEKRWEGFREKASKFMSDVVSPGLPHEDMGPQRAVPDGEPSSLDANQPDEVRELLRLRESLKSYGRGDRATSAKLEQINQRLIELGVIEEE